MMNDNVKVLALAYIAAMDAHEEAMEAYIASSPKMNLNVVTDEERKVGELFRAKVEAEKAFRAARAAEKK